MDEQSALQEWRDEIRSVIAANMNARSDVWNLDATDMSEDGCGGGGGDDGGDDASGGATGGTEVASGGCW
jgi:hypothetical protein